jgi:aspartyl-tRNA(Asn)/glutamyl-tRNA(Gln) amidotransferase subunit B
MKPTIGIEVHVEVNTKSKMFCGCANDPHHSEPNTNICPVCLAHPGTLPTVNREAIEKILLLGKAIGGEIADFSEFDRKQYFYPDIPKAYQLSQYAFPFVKGGELAGVKITRVHLEEDTAKSQHLNASQVDFNRAGVPLIELVTEPVIHDSATAVKFGKELQLLLRTMGISEANMEKGEMRVEANISLSPDEALGTKVEVKNLNSFRIMEQAIEFEISRQTEILAENMQVKQETLGWDEVKSRTFSQRSKETAKDYRYFPDPDIPKYVISAIPEFSAENLSRALPVLPEQKRAKMLEFGLNNDQIETLVYNPKLWRFLEDTFTLEGNLSVDSKTVKLAANYLISDIGGLLLKDENLILNSTNAIWFGKLVQMLAKSEINSRVAKDLLPEVVFEGLDPEKLAKDRGLTQNNSTEGLTAIVDQIVADNAAVASEYRDGKETALQYLVGQGMKVTRGSANPELLASLLKSKLGDK